MRESTIEKRVADAARRAGGMSVKLEAGQGWPDRLVVLPGGRCMFVEVKTKRGRVSALQASRLASLWRLGFDVYIVRGKDGAKAFASEVESHGE